MGIFSNTPKEPYYLRLTRKKAEYKELKSLIERGTNIPGVWIDEIQKLAGEIAVLEEKVVAERDNPTWTKDRI